MSRIRLVHSTLGDRAEAEELAEALIERNLAACVNVGQTVKSFYEWEGESHRDTEIPIQVKTTRESVEDTLAFLEENHPYDCPELLVTKVVRANDAYETWLIDQVQA